MNALLGPVTLVQVVMPAGTVARVQVPVEVGAAALTGPVTDAVNTSVLPKIAVDELAVTTGATVTALTLVDWVVFLEVKE